VENWEKAKTISSVVSVVVIPVVLLWVGDSFSRALKEREIQGKFVELAVEILREQPDKQAHGLREWATQVLNTYSGVPLSLETQKQLIESTPLPTASNSYEGRKDLGNVEPGDGARFVGRGYLVIVGRANYKACSQAIGVDLVSNPELMEKPKVAADCLAAFFKRRESRFAEALANDDQLAARRSIAGGTNGLEDVITKYKAYLAALQNSGKGQSDLQVPVVQRPQWLANDVPEILSALRRVGIDNIQIQAYALATAAHESGEGKFMKEPLP